MIRIVFTFVILAALIHLGITFWQKLNKTERWSLTKTAFYSIMIALLTIVAMMFMVVLF